MEQTNTPTPEGPYRVEVTRTGVGRSDLIRLVGPNGITVANESKGDYSGVTFNFWCKRLNEAYRDALRARCEALEEERDDARSYASDFDKLSAMYAELQEHARPVPPGHIRDDQQVDRRVLGTLPITADGCVIGDGAQVWPRADLYVFQNDGRPSDERPWHPDEEAATAVYCLKENTTGDTIAPEEWHADKVYSSHEAAEGAKEAGQ